MQKAKLEIKEFCFCFMNITVKSIKNINFNFIGIIPIFILSGQLLKWLRDFLIRTNFYFLTQRRQRVVLSTHTSNCIEVKSDVPLGSVWAEHFLFLR